MAYHIYYIVKTFRDCSVDMWDVMPIIIDMDEFIQSLPESDLFLSHRSVRGCKFVHDICIVERSERLP